MKIRKCELQFIDELFNFGRYDGLSLADVLDINPSYIDWCVKYCTGIIFKLHQKALDQIKIAYPNFIIDSLFERRRLEQLERSEYIEELQTEQYDDKEYDDYYDGYCDYINDSPTYDRYNGSWAQDVEGYSDEDIDTIFDGDPSAYWNID